MLTRAEERLIRRLLHRRKRAAEALFLAEGVRTVEELLEAGHVPRLVVVSPSLEETERGAALARRLADAGPVRSITEGALGRLAGTRTPQGVLVVADVPTVDLAALDPGHPSTILLLDGVQDPGNIGTLIRSAAAFGCALVACLPGTADPWNPKSVRAAAGALFRVPVVATGAEVVWQWVDRGGFEVIGADARGGVMEVERVSNRVALVVGNEGAGLGPDARRRCQRLVAVPMRAGTESLNVAVAAGILLYELTRGRA